eukprot:IDg5085t1
MDSTNPLDTPQADLATEDAARSIFALDNAPTDLPSISGFRRQHLRDNPPAAPLVRKSQAAAPRVTLSDFSPPHTSAAQTHVVHRTRKSPASKTRSQQSPLYGTSAQTQLAHALRPVTLLPHPATNAHGEQSTSRTADRTAAPTAPARRFELEMPFAADRTHSAMPSASPPPALCARSRAADTPRYTPAFGFGGSALTDGDGEDSFDGMTTAAADDPWHKSYAPGSLGLQPTTERDRAYSFSSCARNAVADGTYDWNTVFGAMQSDFWLEGANRAEFIRKAPEHQRYLETAPARGSRKNGAPPMTLSEFARLMGLLTKNDSARSALIQSELDLTREQQQRREGRDVFWESLIARLFNDPAVRVDLDLRGCISGPNDVGTVNSNETPAVPRGGAWLKDRFFAVRALFTKSYARWTVSGQNNPEAGVFQNFVAPSPNSTTMSVQGKFTCIMFHALGCGTKEEDTEVLNFTCKLAPHGVGYDDDDEDSMRGGRMRAKRKAQDALLAESERRSKSIEAMVATISSMANALSSSEDVSAGSKSKAACSEREENIGLLQRLQDLTKRRAEIMALDANDAMNKRMVAALERELNIATATALLTEFATELLRCGPPRCERSIGIGVVARSLFMTDGGRQQGAGDVTSVHAKIMETHDGGHDGQRIDYCGKIEGVSEDSFLWIGQRTLGPRCKKSFRALVGSVASNPEPAKQMAGAQLGFEGGRCNYRSSDRRV